MHKSEIQNESATVNKNYGRSLPSKDNLFIRMLQSIFSFEVLFILFLFAWVFKADPRFQWVPIDITMLFSILSVCIGIFVFLGQKMRFSKKATILALSGAAFAFYIFISLNWSAGQIYAVQKTLHISTLTLWALFACAFIIASDKRRLNRFINLILAIAAWIGLASALEYVKGGGGVINALNSNYLALGYTLGMGLIISISYVFFFEQSRLRKMIFFIICLFFMFLLLVLGGRGPLIGVTISLLIPLLYRAKVRLEYKLWIKKYCVFIVILLIAVFSISIYLYSKNSPTATLARILLLFEPGMGTSVSTRVKYYIASNMLWQLKPLLGHGIGSWPILIGLPDIISYPHNLVLEIIVELGLIGLILFCFILILALKGFIKTIDDRSVFFTLAILMMFTNAFIGAMFSGDMNDNRIIFALLGLMTFEEKTNEEKKELKEAYYRYDMFGKRVWEK